MPEISEAGILAQSSRIFRRKGYEELCKRDDIDLVYIATDWLHHFPVAMCAMENGKNEGYQKCPPP